MKIRKFEYRLKYGPLSMLFDLLPPAAAVCINIGIALFGFKKLRNGCGNNVRFGFSLMIAAGIVFGIVYLYEIAESLVTGNNRKVRMENCEDSFLIRFGCRCHYFQRGDVVAIDFDPEKNRLIFFLSRCIEKRRGVCSYMRLFCKTGVKKAFTPVSDYLSPLVTGGFDALKFGVPDPEPAGILHPFSWTPVTNIQMIERRGSFRFAVPCETAQDACEVVTRILDDPDVRTLFSAL